MRIMLLFYIAQFVDHIFVKNVLNLLTPHEHWLNIDEFPSLKNQGARISQDFCVVLVS